MANLKSKKTVPESAPETTSDPLLARLDAEVATLAEADVVKVPGLADERCTHLSAFAKAAKRDLSELSAVALPDGRLEAWEVDALPLALHEAETLAVAVRADQVASGFTLSAADAKKLAEARAAQSTIIWAFRRLRYRGMPAKLKELDAIAAGDPSDVIDARNDSVLLIALATHADERAWFASLECGEPAALATLQRLQPRLQELATLAEKYLSAPARRARLRRLWTVIGRIERRIRDAADYRYRGLDKRAEYRAFETPTVKKRKAVRAVESAKRAATKKATKKAAAEAKKAARKATKKTG